VDDDGQPVGSILEAAKLAGFKTGLVVTSTINHATPACTQTPLSTQCVDAFD
jgi:alkaline phosphatase